MKNAFLIDLTRVCVKLQPRRFEIDKFETEISFMLIVLEKARMHKKPPEQKTI